VLLRLVLRNAQCIERRVYHAHVGAARFVFQRRALRARHAHHVAECGKDGVPVLRERKAVVHAAHRQYAYRAAGSVHELNIFRQDVAQTVTVNGVRVPAADLHDAVIALRIGDALDLPRDVAD
jgi:hypothetical protein